MALFAESHLKEALISRKYPNPNSIFGSSDIRLCSRGSYKLAHTRRLFVLCFFPNIFSEQPIRVYLEHKFQDFNIYIGRERPTPIKSLVLLWLQRWDACYSFWLTKTNKHASTLGMHTSPLMKFLILTHYITFQAIISTNCYLSYTYLVQN